jgi:mono/diheme cytochrome c family protein
MSETASADLVGGVNVLAAWKRQPGQHSDVENPDRGTVTAIDPYEFKRALGPKRLMDLQYGERRSYRGVPLADLVNAYKAGARLDMVILHFEGGMRVPLLRRDLGDLGAFVAVEACNERGKDCAPSFEDVGRRDVYGDTEDPRPIKFSWNKLVVRKAWHPGSRSVEPKKFSPWYHVDTLSGLEFADSAAYEAQFAVGTSGGEAVYFDRCQYCHSTRHVGARFGWDFVTPLALYEKRAPDNLLNHVKYPKAMAQRLGIQMPPQKDVGAAEMQRLWDWMRDVAKQRLKPYAP